MEALNNSFDEAHLLELELSLPGTDIISCGWYHGPISRQKAENALTIDGSFLVRDSASQRGNYVLSCRANGHPLHFVINKILVNAGTVYEHCQYQFEDEAYESIPSLITSYVGSGKPISSASGARIQYPGNRQHSLSALRSVHADERGSNPDHQRQPYKYPDLKLYRQKKRSNSLTPMDKYSHYTHEKSASADGVIQMKFEGGESHPAAFVASNEEWETALQASPPAKPARLSQGKTDEKAASRQRVVYLASGSDSGNGSGDSTQSSATGETLPKSQSNNKINYMSMSSVKIEFDVVAAEEQLRKTQIPEYNQASKFNFETFKSPLLKNTTNKPLESDVLHHIKVLLRTSGARILAKYLVQADLNLFFDETDDMGNIDHFKEVPNMELCLLPQGRQLRIDAIERAECLKLLIAVTIFTCQTDEEKATTINDWILILIETKFALGNLFSFSVIMLGLCMPQVESLERAWHTLRRKYTDNALMFESKLRPSFKRMNECKDPLPPNTTIPHLLPIVMVLQDIERGKSNINNLLFSGNEDSMENFFMLAEHLKSARDIPEQLAMFKRNSKTVLQDLATPQPETDNLLCDLFRTEFQAIFLWGSQGCLVPAEERYARLTNILSTMAQKL